MNQSIEIRRCKCCNAPLGEAINNIIKCEYCGTTLIIPKKETPNKILNYIMNAEQELDKGQFDNAYKMYQKAQEEIKDEPTIYFGMALAEYKVQYLKDEVHERLQPICYEINKDPFTDSKNYYKALTYANEEQRKEYERKGEEIDRIREEFQELEKEKIDYDCFICVKVTDEESKQKTKDSEEAKDIYEYLKEKGYKPFYSEKDIKNKQGSDYEAMILYALYKSECMIVVCSKKEYLQTKWVKNEYQRFKKMITNEEKEKDAITIVYDKEPIDKLPGIEKVIQGIDLSDKQAYERILEYVERHTPEAKKRKEEEIRQKKQEEEARLAQEKKRDETINSLAKQIEEQNKLIADLMSNKDNNQTTIVHDERIQENEQQRQLKEKLRQERKKKEEQYIRNNFEIENGAITEYTGKSTNVVIPSTVKSIGEYAFNYCTSLESIAIPSSVTNIGEYAFYGCKNLREVIIEKAYY